MWSIIKHALPEGKLKRSFFKTVKTALLSLLAALLVVLSISQTTLAYTPSSSTATWSNTSINFDSHTYLGPNNNDTDTALGLPKDTLTWTYVDPAPTGTTSGSPPVRLIHILYFPAGTDMTKASSATYQNFTYISNSSFTNPSAKTNITVNPAGYNSGGSSCALDSGMAWIICPVTDGLATGMDYIYKAISSFMTVQPLQTGNVSPLYRTWSYMRDIANISFIIAFLVIVFSYVTSIGVSNYTLKKMLPRLIVAALLVNISYFVCSIAIDLSNIIGYSLQGIFENIRTAVSSGSNWDLSDTMSFKSVSSFILSGGALAGAGLFAGWLTVSGTGFGMGLVYLFLPAILAAVLAGVVAFFILAARQAIIFILVILSPLAFVAYLLPNTERWFKRWHELGTTMLVMFPMISILFSGAQLAGTVIIMNADTINLIILGLMVMVIPLFATPFLLKFSGSFLSNITGIINDPNKGILDRTRKWADYHADNIRQRRLGDSKMAKDGKGAAWWQFARRTHQGIDRHNRTIDGKASAAKAQADARWSNDKRYRGIYADTRTANERKQIGEWAVEKLYEDNKFTKPTYTRYNGKLMVHDDAYRQAETDLKIAKGRVELHHEQHKPSSLQRAGLQLASLEKQIEAAKAKQAAELEKMFTQSFTHTANYAAMSNQMQSYVDSMRDAQQQVAIQGMAKASAENLFKEDIFKSLESSAALRDIAGASDIDKSGATRAEATALGALSEIESKRTSNIQTLFIERAKKEGKSANTYVKDMLGTKDEPLANAANLDDDQFAAAMDMMAKSGEISMFREGKYKLSGDKLRIMNGVIGDNFKTFADKNAISMLSNIQPGPYSKAEVDAMVMSDLAGTAASKFAEFKGSDFKNFAKNIDDSIAAGKKEDIAKAYNNIVSLLSNPQYRDANSDKMDQIMDIAHALHQHPENHSKPNPDDLLNS